MLNQVVHFKKSHCIAKKKNHTTFPSCGIDSRKQLVSDYFFHLSLCPHLAMDPILAARR